MKFRYSIYSAILLFCFSACSKKIADVVEESPEIVEEVVTNEIKTNTETFRHNPPQAGPARKIQLGDSHQFELDNGLTVIVVENHKLPRVSYQVSLKNEAVKEGNKAGYVSIAGDLMGRGTSSRSKAEIDEQVDFIGATLNTSGYGAYGSSLTKHQDKLLEVMSDVLFNPSFPSEEFDKIMTQNLSGLEASKTDPGSIASNVTKAVNYGSDHPFGEIITKETLGRVTVDDCKNYYKGFFNPSNAYLIIVGDITPDQAKLSAETYFGGWANKPMKNWKFDNVAKPDGRNVAFANKDGAVQSSIRVTYPVDFHPASDEAIAASVMNTMLGGGGFIARLFQNLREDKGYTYGAYSSLSSDPIQGHFTATADVRNEVTDSSIHEFLFELRKMRDERVSLDELQNIKNYMNGTFAMQLESPQTIARFARNIARYDLPADYYETYLERLNAVTPADIQAVAQKYIRPDKANIVVVGSKDDVVESLVQFDDDGVIDYYDYKGEKLEIKEMDIPASLNAESVISDYINAIGGAARLKAVKSLQTKSTMNVMGQEMESVTFQKDNKLALKMTTGGMTMMEQKYDGSAMSVSQMGQSQVMTEGPEVESLKYSATIFEQLNYGNDGYVVELKGNDNLDGVNVYKLVVTDPSGSKKTEYYNAENSQLIRQVAIQGGQNITTDLSDYKEVDGVMYPHKITITGAAPVPLVSEVSEVLINGDISDEVFAIEQ